MISIFCIIAGFTCCCTSIAAELIKHTKYKHLLRLRPDITLNSDMHGRTMNMSENKMLSQHRRFDENDRHFAAIIYYYIILLYIIILYYYILLYIY